MRALLLPLSLLAAPALGKTTRHDKLLQRVRSDAPDRKVRNAANAALRHAR